MDFTKEFQQFLTFPSFSNIEKKDDESQAVWMYTIIIDSNMIECFPNVETGLRLYLSLMISNCSGERSFSLLKRVKNFLRSTMSQDHLTALSLLSIESEILRSLNFEDIIHEFATAKARKMHI